MLIKEYMSMLRWLFRKKRSPRKIVFTGVESCNIRDIPAAVAEEMYHDLMEVVGS